MAQLSSVISALSRKNTDDEPADIVGALSGFGNILGIIAALLGLLAGISLVPLTSLTWVSIPADNVLDIDWSWTLAGNELIHVFTAAFMGLLALGLLLQALGSKNLRARIGGMFGNVFYIGFFAAAAVAVYAFVGYGNVTYDDAAISYLSTLYLMAVAFVILWQMISIFYVDSSLTWVGFIAGMLNGLFIPVLALGIALGPIFIYIAYGLLLGGQVMALLYWWSSRTSIRGFARSPDKAKFAFGLSGLLTFIIGAAAVLIGPLEGIIWRPWSAPVFFPEDVAGIHFLTNPALIYAFLAMMLFWILLSPRLGARELKTAAIGEDIVKGGSKWFAIFMVMVGILAASQAGVFTFTPGGWGFFLVIGPASAMVLIGSMYTAKTDIVTGLPLIIAGIFTMIHPFTLSILVLIPWLLVIITQLFLMIECYWRGTTGFSQGALTVLLSVISSATIILFMIGYFGQGPLAIWPTNLWFNISLFPGIDPAIQSATVIILPFLMLLLRNSALAGFSYGRGYTTGGILMGGTVLFSLMIPIIAENATVTHEANTGAALLIALYAISMFIIMSLNLNLANDVQEKGHDLEGNLIKFSTIGQLLMGAVMIVLVLVFFSGLPTPEQIAFVVTFMVIFVVGSEILSIIGWFIAGARLGLLKEGFKIQRPAQ